MAHPAVLQDLVDRYETLEAQIRTTPDPEVQRRLEDVTYTLCVTTGTRDADAALVAARNRLLATRFAARPVEECATA